MSHHEKVIRACEVGTTRMAVHMDGRNYSWLKMAKVTLGRACVVVYELNASFIEYFCEYFWVQHCFNGK